MAVIKNIKVPLNRVEGDLEVRVDVEDGFIREARSSGLMYRGFENMLSGRGAMDGLVLTPRICGICSNGHLKAAAKALDMAGGFNCPPDAVRLRNITLMTEMIHSDMRHAFLMFAVDFLNPAYKDLDMYQEAKARYEPYKGSTILEVVQKTKKILGIIALIGGQWPHSSFIVPGGIASVPSTSDLLKCQVLLEDYKNWYENKILGCSLQRWAEVNSLKDLDAWLEEKDCHRKSELGFFINYARKIGLDQIGSWKGNYISAGAFELPEDTAVKSATGSGRLVQAGFSDGESTRRFEQENIAEHVYYSWFRDYEGGRHPFTGETIPYATGNEGHKYSWAKAPRYEGLPAETGPLAEMVVGERPLFKDLVQKIGPCVFTRQLARLVRAAELIPAMETWLVEATPDGKYYDNSKKLNDGEGFGITEVTRGFLGHWVRIKDEKIVHYEIITPTTWNASPRDSAHIPGPWEQSLQGTKIQDVNNPLELGHIIRSFDACLVCTVHALELGKKSQGKKLVLGL